MGARTAERVMPPITHVASEGVWSRAFSAADASTSGRGNHPLSSHVDDEDSAVVLLSEETAASEAAPLVPHNALKHAFCGGVSGALAKTCIAPLARLTILYQVRAISVAGPAAAGQQLGLMAALRHVAATEGLLSLWKGNLVTIMHRVPYSATNFFTYESTKRVLQGRLPSEAARSWAAGAAAGLVACTAAYPLDLLRTRIAAETPAPGQLPQYRRVRTALSRILAEQGVRGLYKGLGATLAQVVPGLAFNFCFYDSFKSLALHYQQAQHQHSHQRQLAHLHPQRPQQQHPQHPQQHKGEPGVPASSSATGSGASSSSSSSPSSPHPSLPHHTGHQQQHLVPGLSAAWRFSFRQHPAGGQGAIGHADNRGNGRDALGCREGGSASPGPVGVGERERGQGGTPSLLSEPAASSSSSASSVSFSSGSGGSLASATPAPAPPTSVSPLTSALCACLSGLCTSSLIFPLDVVRRRLQVYDRGPLGKLSYLDVVRNVYGDGGLRAFYRGIGPEYAKVVPGMAIAFTTYEALKRLTGAA